MSEQPSFIDDLGPEKVVQLYDSASGLKAVVVIDNVAAGPSIGGVRMAPDASAEECFRLARAMTLKNAAAGLAHGGGKSVIMADPRSPNKESLVRAFAAAIADLRDYIPGPDMGTDEVCMAWIKDEMGRAVGLPPEIGGIPLDRIGATGYGLARAVEVAKDFCDLDLAGARVAVQGFGSVGYHAARFLGEMGAVLVAAADSGGTISDPDGLDLEALAALKADGGSVTDLAGGGTGARNGARGGDRSAIVEVPCDIWIPAARPDVIDADNVERLNTKLVAQGANIPITEAAEARLHAKGILNLPDFIANAGGVICAAVEYHGGNETLAMQTIADKITANTQAVLRDSAATGIPPRQAALALARRRVAEAMSYRRRF